MKTLKYYFFIFGLLVLNGCSDGEKSVESYVAEVKKTKPGKIDILPPEKEYKSMDFTAQNYLSPFEKGVRNSDYLDETDDDIRNRPDASRKREFLEHDPLDTFIMVGTLSKGTTYWALVKDRRGMVHAVRIGDYMGQNSGRVIGISEDGIKLIETVSDGKGGWVKQDTLIKLKAN